MKDTPEQNSTKEGESPANGEAAASAAIGPVSREAGKAAVRPEEDAPLKEILLYAFGNIEGGLANGFYNLMNSLMIVALQMNPMVMGFILSVKTLWDGMTDPIMAHVTDRARTRWGRRRPFILVGGLSRVFLLVLIFLFFPQDESIKTNAELAAEKEAKVAEQVAAFASEVAADEALADVAMAEAGLEGAPAVEPEEEKPQALPGMPRPRRASLWENLTKGVKEFFANENPYHRTVALYVLVACLLFTTLTTVQSVPYWALGIELAPSYDGRTRVVTYRSFVDKIMSAVAPWILPFCFLPIFFNVIEGLLWYAFIVVAVGAPSTILMVMYTRERLMKSIAKTGNGPGLLLSMWQTGKNIHFLKILFLFQFIGITNGVFAQFMLFLNIYWVFGGDALAGATMGGYVGTLGVVVSIFALPLVNWSCRRFQKHRALRYAIIWMSVGSAAKWFIFTPDSPYLQLALPFFFSIGISAVFTILPTMMADVTDIDELRHGVRREGMFGAVMAFLMKLTGAIQPLLAGAMLVVSGFDVSLGADQAPETIHNMRLLFSLVPASLLLLGLIALWRYPLTREYMENVKAQLLVARAQRAAQQDS